MIVLAVLSAFIIALAAGATIVVAALWALVTLAVGIIANVAAHILFGD